MTRRHTTSLSWHERKIFTLGIWFLALLPLLTTGCVLTLSFAFVTSVASARIFLVRPCRPCEHYFFLAKRYSSDRLINLGPPNHFKREFSFCSNFRAPVMHWSCTGLPNLHMWPVWWSKSRLLQSSVAMGSDVGFLRRKCAQSIVYTLFADQLFPQHWDERWSTLGSPQPLRDHYHCGTHQTDPSSSLR